jgi:protoporphyrinogen oxidase
MNRDNVSDNRNNGKKAVIIGAGPAGLTAAYELANAGIKSTVIEKDGVVGGLARTVNYRGYRFDIGGHRFFTKVRAVESMWRDVLGQDFLKRERLSRIYYNNRFFYYPFRLRNALFGLGVWNSVLIAASYLKSQLSPELPEDTFDKWVSNRFGRRLYGLFFKTYTEKVWGIPCSEISAEWAAQRIKGLSLMQALRNALLKDNDSGKKAPIRTLIDSFDYPRLGPGMMWEAVAEKVTRDGSELLLNSDVKKIHVEDRRVEKIEIDTNGESSFVYGTDFISSMPIRELIQKLDPAPPEEVIRAARDLHYRDFLTVSLVVDKPDVFPDNWIYIHEPGVKLGRIQNFKNWSGDMVPDPGKTCLGLEYFCFEGDGLWSMSDRELIELGKEELEKLNLVSASLVVDGSVVRMPKAYPVYDAGYRESLRVIREYLAGITNLQLVGRNGMHKYNNQDHSMLTAMLAAKNILGADYDLWKVNADQEYHEEIADSGEKGLYEFRDLAGTQPSVPEPLAAIRSPALDQAIISAFARLDKFAFAVSVGTVSGLAVFLATLILILKGGQVVGPTMNLLGQYFAGYSVTTRGALIGFGYAFLWGFILGWLFAYLRNIVAGLYVFRIIKERDYSTFKNFIDYI